MVTDQSLLGKTMFPLIWKHMIEYIPFPGEKENNGIIDADHSKFNEELSKEIRDNHIRTSVILPTGGRILERGYSIKEKSY